MLTHKHPLLTISQQIVNMKQRGVSFVGMQEDAASEYLRRNNNYFRLRSYRCGFERISDGEFKDNYVNLDFAMLVDLATIDMHLRYALLPMSLEIEHSYKIKLLQIIEENQEDGYQIVKDYIEGYECDGTNNSVLAEIKKGENGPYTCGLISNYNNEYPVWVFIELITFGQFIRFWRFCAKRYDNDAMRDDFFLLQSVKGVRNACAHNNCILNDMSAGRPKYNVRYSVRRAVGNTSIGKQMARSKLSNERLIQLTTTLYVHKEVASAGIISAQSDELNHLVNRMYRHADYYQKNDQIRTGFEYITALVRAWYPLKSQEPSNTV